MNKDRIASFVPDRVKYVVVTYKKSGIESRYMCYNDGNGVIKLEDDFLWVRSFRVTAAVNTHSDDIPYAYWQQIAPISRITYTLKDYDE